MRIWFDEAKSRVSRLVWGDIDALVGELEAAARAQGAELYSGRGELRLTNGGASPVHLVLVQGPKIIWRVLPTLRTRTRTLEPILSDPIELADCRLLPWGFSIPCSRGAIRVTSGEDWWSAIEPLIDEQSDGSVLTTLSVPVALPRGHTAWVSVGERLGVARPDIRAPGARLELSDNGGVDVRLRASSGRPIAELTLDDSYQLVYEEDARHVPRRVMGRRSTVPPRWLIASGPTRLAGGDFVKIAFPLLDSRFEGNLKHRTRSAFSEFERNRKGGLRVRVAGRLGSRQVDESRARLAVYPASLELLFPNEESVVVSAGSLTAAYTDAKTLYLLGPELGAVVHLRTPEIAQALGHHAVIRRPLAEMEYASALLGDVTLNGVPRGVAWIDVSDNELECRFAGGQTEVVRLGDIAELRLGGEEPGVPRDARATASSDGTAGSATITAPQFELELSTSEAELRDLLSTLWTRRVQVPPRVLGADYRHPLELAQAALIEALTTLSRESLLGEKISKDEGTELTDLLGRGLEVTAEQFGSLKQRLDAVARVLEVEPPPLFVVPGEGYEMRLTGALRPRVEMSTRCLADLEEDELDFLLARNCAHLALGHHLDRAYGEKLLEMLAQGDDLGENALASTGAFVGQTVGTGLGVMAGGVGVPMAARMGAQIGRAAVTAGASGGGFFDAEGEQVVRQARVLRWLRLQELSADAFGYLYVGDLRTALRAVLIASMNDRRAVMAAHLPQIIAKIERIEGVEGNAAIYSRLNEESPYIPQRVAELVAFACSRRGGAALARIRRIRNQREDS